MIKKLEKAIIFSLYLYVIFAPHSIFLSEASVILGLVLWGVKAAAARKLEGRCQWTKGNLQKPILCFCAIGVFSLLTAYDRLQALGQVKSFWLFSFYFLVINNLNERKDIIRLVTLLIISTAIASLYGLYQYFFMHTIAVQAFIKNVITLAGLFLLVIPISFGLFLGENQPQGAGGSVISRRWRWVYLAASLVLLPGIVFTLERSVWLGLGIVILTFIIMDRRTSVVLGCGVVILAVLFSLSPALRQRSRTLSHFRNYAISSRFHQWQAGLEMMLDHPVTGVGPGNFEVLYKQYKFFEERKTYSHAHSNIVQIGAETGILGLSMFFWMMVEAFKIIWKRVRGIKEPLFSYLSLGVLAAFFGLHFAGLFEYNFGDSEVQLLFWFMLGSMEKI